MARAQLQTQTGEGVFMDKRLIWIDGDDFTGWCCSHCTWAITAPHLDSTVAALAFNRTAQEDFEKHRCADSLARDLQC
jgi:hypothetical protein